ncbi:hypothetical protein [Acidocella aminolytica]|jgi:hypothetical protein|uniref:Uncharacterized protein n=1 Tax=Acidocella aminolytica 101 = DSM 11237 TaxID=1120923 RepID=A0A0D6PHF0_9PROT|nr:hypothetical protein [Acidocella aminolytica]GAN80623.1 hypothetical protein Aam_055_003 [Acidocella aminolytica 101 = DSM 11237]GBQ40169.1 hypothetical protein AA11237_2280 [Acidocella aminolytica 101 = DSM 11237]SHE55924.1 hypothetical protein SAMN02746095_00783 [Acidocella aminolytica 101 = DSM 11237]
MYADELFAHLDELFGQDWRPRIDSHEIKDEIDKWITRQIGKAVGRAIEGLSEEQ